MKQPDKKLVLETGQEFPGFSAGANVPAVGEIVFNTSVEGYQEIISDPAYYGQILVLTYPTIGQYGITDEDYESRKPGLVGLVVRDNCDTPSNFRFTKTLGEELAERDVPMLCGPDTRMLARIIREKPGLKAAIVDAGMSKEEALKLISFFKQESNIAKYVSCSTRKFSRTSNHRFDVLVLDLGVKHSMVLELNKRGCNVTQVPWNSTAEEILAFHPDGLLISSGPGDADKLPEVVKVIEALRGKLPMMGVSLGCQLLAQSYGAGVRKLTCGHYGGHPVRETATGKIFSAEHNHDFTIVEDGLVEKGLEVTFKDLNDGTVEGIRNVKDKIMGVQFYPCGAPGPQDCHNLMDEFIAMMED